MHIYIYIHMFFSFFFFGGGEGSGLWVGDLGFGVSDEGQKGKEAWVLLGTFL